MIIGTIVDGIVIDHIPAGRGMDLYRDLGLDKLECEVAVIKNASSGKYGKKDILKINEVIDLNLTLPSILSAAESGWRKFIPTSQRRLRVSSAVKTLAVSHPLSKSFLIFSG